MPARREILQIIVLKRPASLYYPGRRTREWLKIGNIRAVDVRVGGWLPGTGARRNLAGSVLMGIPRPGALEFAGTAGSGLTVAELRELTALLDSCAAMSSPESTSASMAGISAAAGSASSSGSRAAYLLHYGRDNS